MMARYYILCLNNHFLREIFSQSSKWPTFQILFTNYNQLIMFCNF